MENGLVKREVMMEIIGCFILIMVVFICCVYDFKGENICVDFLFLCLVKVSVWYNNIKMVYDFLIDIDCCELDFC